tara:strand:- start:271 stop:606 length:336 start_codon:yes stop_codon:yes gene_type:complete
MSEERIYTLTLEQIDGIADDAVDGLNVSRNMLKHHLNQGETNNICALLAELLWANYNITKLLEDELYESEPSEEGHVVISEKVLGLLQTLVFSKEMAGLELNKLSISTRLN